MNLLLRFKRNKLIRKDGLIIKDGINNYGMKLINLEERSVKDMQFA